MSGENQVDHSSQFALDSALKQGLRVVVPSAFELLVDIDSDTDFDRFKLAYHRAACSGIVSGYSARPSKSGNAEHQHITVTVPLKITPIERVALQAILGSDWRRELHSIERLREGDPIPTLFFEADVVKPAPDNDQSDRID